MDTRRQLDTGKTNQPTDYTEKYLERWQQADPDEYVQRLSLGWEEWELCAEQFASSIKLANELAQERWGLTDRGDHIRLNVGKVEAVVINSAWLQVMVDRPAFEGDRIEEEDGVFDIEKRERYSSMPSAAFVYLSLDDPNLVDRLESIQTAHRTHLRAAVATPCHPMTRRGHHPGLVEAIAATVGRPLPQPSYISVQGPPGMSGAGRGRAPIFEGRERDIVQTKAERDPRARAACLAACGYACACCDRTLEGEYGPEAAELIHVHHLISFKDSPGDRVTDPVSDLVPVCPNCHMVIHSRDPMYEIDEARALRAKIRGFS